MVRLVLIIVCLLASCGGDQKPALVDLPRDPGALFVAPTGATVVAEVGDWKITEEDLLAFHSGRPVETLRESLDVLLDHVVTVQSGLEGDFEPRFEVLVAWRKALAKSWISKRIHEDFGPDSIPEETLRATWEVTWFLWDHENAYHVMDAQSICCFQRPPSLCDAAAFSVCIDQHRDMMDNLWRVLEQEAPRDKDSFTRVAKEFASAHGVAVRVEDYAFQHDHSKAYDEQKGYDRADEAVAMAMKDLELNRFTPVVESEYGLHILYLYRFRPEVHKTLDDPDVRAEIVEKIYPKLQDREIAKVFSSLTLAADIGFFTEVMEQVNWSQVTGLEQKK